jgi:WD40 domain-containing protein
MGVFCAVQACFSPDGRSVLTASADRTARLWSVDSGQPVGGSMQHEDAVLSARFSPDGRRVITASGDHTGRLWDASSGQSFGDTMKHQGSVLSAEFSPDGRRVVTASDDRTARVWDASTGQSLCEVLRHGGAVKSAEFSPDGQRVLTASDDKAARLWDLPSITDKDTEEEGRLLADLAEATGGVALQTSAPTELLNELKPEKVKTIRLMTHLFALPDTPENRAELTDRLIRTFPIQDWWVSADGADLQARGAEGICQSGGGSLERASIN